MVSWNLSPCLFLLLCVAIQIAGSLLASPPQTSLFPSHPRESRPADGFWVLPPDLLWEEGKAALEQLLKFMVHPAISSINLTTALGSLANIARQRPMFMSEVIQAYETLHGR